MPAFTYVASIIVAEVIGIAGAAILGSAGVAFVTSVIALGLATVTSRLINGAGGGAGGTAQDPGVRIQFPPATNNKIPILYGSANTKGTITDARLSSSDGVTNDTMTYVLVISEKTQTGTFSVGNIYWNDQLLVMKTAAGSEHIVASSIDQNGFGTSNTNFDGLIKMRIYSGSTLAANQIFPAQATGNTENARTALGESDTNYLLSDLVFAVIQVKYSSEKGTTGLGQITFQVNNTLDNPGDVWYDFCTSSRYGAGFTATSVNTVTSISSTSTSLKSISNTIPKKQFTSAGSVAVGGQADIAGNTFYLTTGTLAVGDVIALQTGNQYDGYATITADSGGGYWANSGWNFYVQPPGIIPLSPYYVSGGYVKNVSLQPRYEINGVLSTGDTVKNNFDKICMSCESWTTYDFNEGKWVVIPNRAATAGELANAFEFNDNNIIGDISVNATGLEDLFNLLEVEYASRQLRDQNDYYRAEIDAIERNDLEPDNTLNLRLEMANNALHAGRIGLIELKQSRVDLIVSFTANWTALSVRAGDVIKVTADVFDFNEKLFRVTKTREIEADDSTITVEVTALEYNADIYTDEELTDSSENTGSGIGSFANSLPAPATPTVTGYATAATPYFTVNTTISSGSLPVDRVDFFIATSSSGPWSGLSTVQGPFISGDSVTTPNIAGRASNTYYFYARTTISDRTSPDSSASSAFVWTLAPSAPGTPFWDTSTSTNVDLFLNASTPHFYIHSIVPVGGITVSSITFQYSTNSSSGFTSLITMNGPYTAGTDVRTTAITGAPAGTYYFRAFSTNNGNNSSASTSSIALVWNPNPAIDGGVIP